jgi:hypothetical protein
MANLAHVVRQLRKERLQALRRVEQLDEALNALSGVGLASLRRRMALGTSTPLHITLMVLNFAH